jgi:hypothetical protein
VERRAFRPSRRPQILAIVVRSPRVGVGSAIANEMRIWLKPTANLIDWKKMGYFLGCGSEDLGSGLFWFQKQKGMGEVGQPFPIGVPKSNGESRR